MSGVRGAGLLFFELMFVTFRTLFVALFTWPEEMLIIKKACSRSPHALRCRTMRECCTLPRQCSPALCRAACREECKGRVHSLS